MRVYFDNVDMNSSSGPNSFARKLSKSLSAAGHIVTQEKPDVQLSFITTQKRIAPTVLRLDGIYFNSEQDWEEMNKPLKASYDRADGVVFQTFFDKELIERYFGTRDNTHVIHNSADESDFDSIPRFDHPLIQRFTEVWSCSSSWRPHKRLKDNVEYFLSKAPKTACLIVLGQNPDYVVSHSRVLYGGHADWQTCVSVYKRSSTFVHLAYLDHCPNVVVDARIAGCKIIAASSGGTKEITGKNSVLIADHVWDFSPTPHYRPPTLDYDAEVRNEFDVCLDMKQTTNKYVQCLQELTQ